MRTKYLTIMGIISLLLFLAISFKPDLSNISGKQVADQPCSGAVGICKSSPCHLYASYSSSELCKVVTGGTCDSGYYCCTALSTNPSISACTEIAECLQKHGRCMNNPCYLYSSYSTSEKCYSIGASCEGKYCCSATGSGDYACINPTCSGVCKPSECSNYADCSTSSEKCASDKFCCSGSCCPTKDSDPMLNIITNVAECLNSSTNNNFYGTISFKLGAGWELISNESRMSLTIFNDQFSDSRIITFEDFMDGATPSIQPTSLVYNGKIYPSYDTCNKNIIATIYIINLGVFGFGFPEAGEYNYSLEGIFIDKDKNEENRLISQGSFTTVYNCSLGLGAVSFKKSGGGSSFRNNDRVECSADAGGKFFSDLTQSPHILNITYYYSDGAQYLAYKNFLSTDSNSNIACSNGKCSVSYNVIESHLNNWKCVVSIGDGFEWKDTKESNIVTMTNSFPSFGRTIPNKTWETKKDYKGAYNLNNYFFDVDKDSLIYSVGGNYHLIINISDNGTVDFFQWPPEYVGNESVWFFASDGQNQTKSNLVTLRVVGNISAECTANWNCTNYTICQSNNMSYCSSAVDLGECGLSYTGNYSEFASKPCIYFSVSPTNISGEKKPTAGNESPVSPPIQKEKPKKNNELILIIFGIILLGSAGAVTFIKFKDKFKLIFKKKEKKLPEVKEVSLPQPEVFTTKKVEMELRLANLNELKEYVKNMIEKGGNLKEIKNKLIGAGWNKKDIDEAVNLAILDKFVKEKLKSGLSKEKIKEMLIKKKWNKELIEKILK